MQFKEQVTLEVELIKMQESLLVWQQLIHIRRRSSWWHNANLCGSSVKTCLKTKTVQFSLVSKQLVYNLLWDLTLIHMYIHVFICTVIKYKYELVCTSPHLRGNYCTFHSAAFIWQLLLVTLYTLHKTCAHSMKYASVALQMQ